MNFPTPKNVNYCAIVVKLSTFVDLPNCSNVRATLIFNNSVIVGKDTPIGAVGLFFPVETALSPAFMAANNLYRDNTLNNDPSQKGYFETHGRIKAMKFRGHKSEGFWIPIQSLTNLNSKWAVNELAVGAEFDTLDEQEICHKYLVNGKVPGEQKKGKQGRKPSVRDQILDGQFHFHFDTSNLRRNVHAVYPDSVISISDKWHGTSAIIANILTNRKLSLFERVLNKLKFAQIASTRYDYVWSSRRVVKGVGGKAKADAVHFYKSDIWGIVATEVQDRIPEGFTVYGEVVGYLPEGKAIQKSANDKAYHYGCTVGQHKFVVYRVTVTTTANHVIELSWIAMKEFCEKYGFNMVQELYYGRASDIVSQLAGETVPEWQERFLTTLEARYVKNDMCKHNNFEVPAEGIVVRMDHFDTAESYKLKNFLFLEDESKELDKGEEDIESAQSEEEDSSSSTE